MGSLKVAARKAVRRNNHVPNQTTEAQRICKKHRRWAKQNTGKLMMWKVRHNHVLKAPQLVRIVKAYPYHVLLEKTTYAIDGSEYKLRYSVSYCSIHCGFDTFSEMEGGFRIGTKKQEAQ